MIVYKAQKIELQHDFVMVRRIDTEMTPGGIYLIHNKNNESNVAKIVGVGPGIEGRPETTPKCEVGEYWLIAKFIGTKVDLDGAEHIIVRWHDCQGKVHFTDEALKLLDQALVAKPEEGKREETAEAS